MILLFLSALVVLMHRLLLLDAEHIEYQRGPTRIICPTCQRDIAPQVYHWHTRSHVDE